MNRETSQEQSKVQKSTFESIRSAAESKYGKTLVGAGILLGSLSLAACSEGSAAPAPAETGTSTTVETEPEITYIEELAANLAERPTVGSAEYEALVDSYRIKASEHSTPEEIALAFGDTLVQDWFTAGFDEIPKNYYEQSQVVYASIGDLAEMLEPGYWNEVFSEALFGTDIANLTAEQLKVYEAIVGDQNMFIKQRILTNDQDHPTDLTASNESVEFDYTSGIDRDGDVLNGRYKFTFWPNQDNSLTNVGDEQTEINPRDNSIGFTLRLDEASGSWHYVGGDN